MSKKYIVGLTGGIGSGKSTVADAFKRLGVRVIDADQASRALVEPESEALKEITNHFDDQTLLVDGSIFLNVLCPVKELPKINTELFSEKQKVYVRFKLLIVLLLP